MVNRPRARLSSVAPRSITHNAERTIFELMLRVEKLEQILKQIQDENKLIFMPKYCDISPNIAEMISDD